ncbi:questin oxidase family protein [Clostridium sp. AL.422]|uniref:questin oxidase family protein n=1 Tax=Clostridium TaxID=1485 RepID=UPI00293DEFCA|nr:MULTISPECIES: questin oxidase family protein [unclassified Clostridium]MDV4149432.1 questin oxidase family protein [Clostridium sp. AL.422]
MFKQFFNKYKDYASDYNGGLSSHIPMVSYSLYELEVPFNEIEKYLDDTIGRIKISKENFIKIYNINDDNFEEYLGLNDSFASYYEYFSKKINESNYLDVIGEFLPQLIKGVAARAFHPLIRLSFAVRSENEEEVIRSLSYFAETFITNEFDILPPKSENLLEDLKVLVESIKNEDYSGNLIADRIRNIYGFDGFKKNAFTLKGNYEDIVLQLDKIINKLFVQTKNFTILHGVTSKEAIKTLLPLVKDKEYVLQNYWIAILGAYISIGSPEIKDLNIDIPKNLPDFKEIIRANINSNNDHSIKLANTCRIEFERSGDSVYKYMAFLRAYS